MKTVCTKNMCDGCIACVDFCNHGAISIQDDIRHYNAVIDENKCVKCGKCHKVCQRNNDIKLSNPIRWYQGWASNPSSRKKAHRVDLVTR